ncbi:MAG: hypothetical protein Q8S03_12990 [Brevundimonas sp.]|uniref:hypothetical protein n=1 Tax=Brevundimonas sp. TaxID=1871086 RepID=UPI0027326383|nr:hypothetical protein [Brevundimonas sp.]MDP3405604.1 hypothetical protein [Brevundimonas sp.]
MRLVLPRLGASLAIIAVATILGSCASGNAEAEAEAARLAEAAAIAARQPPPVALNDSVAQAASVYLTFTRDVTAIQGGFASAEAVQAALRRGAAYDPDQISRGLVAYASILALQSPEFVSGVRSAAATPAERQQLVARIVADPEQASTLPGADAAAGLIISMMETDIIALANAADTVETDAYTIQYAGDPRNGWGRAPASDRDGRLQAVKDLSARSVLPSPEETARLYAAAHDGSGLGTTGLRTRRPPYAPSVANALAMAALAVLGAAGDNARANTDALQYDRTSQDCLASSKLNLFQCLAASRPAYEDMFCLGRHVMRDLATCARGAALPSAIVTVDDPTASRATAPVAPRVTPQALPPAPADARPTPARTPPPAQTSTPTPTQRLNSGPNR